MAGRIAFIVIVAAIILSGPNVRVQEPDPAEGITQHTHEYLAVSTPVCHTDHCLPLLFEGDRRTLQRSYPELCWQRADRLEERVTCVPTAHVLDLMSWGKVQ